MTLPCGIPESDPPSFLEHYLHHCGISKVPPEFHVWCGLSALAACVADRVYYEKFRGEKLTPNLYVMLIGPSGVGKNQAIRRAQKLVEAIPNAARVQVYRGKITAQDMMTHLSKQKKFGNYIWLITPELAMQVGNGPKAEDFITHMTELFDSDTTVQDSTRTSGHFVLQNPCINWLPGTTREWLFRSVGKHDILGGFFARILAVPGEPSATRYPQPIFPADYDTTHAWLVQYLDWATSLAGRFTLDADAQALHDWWYATRPEPDDELLRNFYEHGDNLLLKLTMVLALADEFRMVAEYDHVAGAIALYEWVYARLGAVLEFAHQSQDSERMNMVAEYIRLGNGSWTAHVDLMRFATNRGMTREMLSGITQTLLERHDIEIVRVEKGKGYRWRASS